MINLRRTNFNTFSGRGGYVFSIGRFPSLVESVLSVQMDVLSPMHLLLVRGPAPHGAGHHRP